jgi:hypothetical protein
MVPLGYKTAKAVVTLGRRAFFGSARADLPSDRSPVLQKDDLTPQFGYVGSHYANARVLILGINPGNGPRDDFRTAEDEMMMPALRRFAAEPSPKNFEAATEAYKIQCKQWSVWKFHCAEVIKAGKLSLEEIAYSNCLPWRTGSKSNFSDFVARNTVELYAFRLIAELNPTLVIALGKRAGQILHCIPRRLPQVIVWNRARAATTAVKQERAACAASVFKALDR